MAFPTTSVIDSGARTENPLSNSGKWTNKLDTFYANNDLKADGSTIVATTAPGSAWYNVAQYADCEIYSTYNNAGGDYLLFFRTGSVGTGAVTGYWVEVYTADGHIYIYKSTGDVGAATQLGSAIVQAFSAGDSFGASMIGSTITIYYKVGAGAWASLGTRTDATYATGYLGLWTDRTANGAGFSNVGGGAAVTPATSTQIYFPVHRSVF